MRLRPVVSRLAAVAPLVLLSACVVSSEKGSESAGEAFFEFILILFIVAIIGTIVCALLLAGGVAAILAGIRRVKEPPRQHHPADPAAPSSQPPAGPAPPSLPGSGEPPPPIPAKPGPHKQPDTYGVALIIFGAVLVLAAGPFVFGDNGFGTNIRIPLPLLVVAGVLVFVGLRRRRG